MDVRSRAPQTEDALDCVLLDGVLAAELQQQNLPELATQIAPDWDLPADAVESGLKTLRSHLEQAEGGAALLYEMT